MAFLFVVLVLFSSLDSLLGNEDYQCMDQKGQIRDDGETWIAEGCRECMCNSGSVDCVKLEVRCRSPPAADCVEIPGPCCPEYDCPDIADCYDVICEGPPELNCETLINYGECFAHNWICPDCSAVKCPEPPRLLCAPIIPPGECCAVDWQCSCRDLQGELRDQGEFWTDPEDPCMGCSCHEGVTECFHTCSRSIPPNTGGCVDDQGLPHDEGDMWMDPTDPCTFCSCEESIALCYVRDCPPPPHSMLPAS